MGNADRDWVELSEGGPVPGSRAHQAYLEIRRRIVQLEMPPEHVFTEGSLADDLSMSKTPVREALSVLAFDGYVVVMPHSGYRVSSLTLRDVSDLFAIHVPLTRGALTTCLVNEQDIDELAMLLSARGPGDEPGRPDPFLEHYLEFQVGLAKFAGNRRLRPLLARLLRQHERLLRLCVQKGAAPGDLVGDDAPTLEALRARDRPAAADAAEARLQACREAVLRALVSVDDILDAAIRG